MIVPIEEPNRSTVRIRLSELQLGPIFRLLDGPHIDDYPPPKRPPSRYRKR